MKKLIIINGVTGAVGTACLARYSREKDTFIYGLSRKGFDYKETLENPLIPQNTNIFSIGDITSTEDCKNFVTSINTDNLESITYIHAVGYYPFEIDKNGKVFVSGDNDGDGIDDRVTELSYQAFYSMLENLNILKLPCYTVIIGSVADKHKPEVHSSWWKTMQKVKDRANSFVKENKNITINILNISSVICPHEILTRPFVFQNTNADASFWLTPDEVANKIFSLATTSNEQLHEEDLFHKASYYEDDYFSDINFTERKKKELGIRG
jgi:hypothetical protein